MRDDHRRPGRPREVNRLVYGLYALCALVFLADLLYAKHPFFDVENVFGFYAVFGFFGAMAMTLLAGRLRRVLARGEDYYGDERHERPEQAAQVERAGRTGDDD